MTSKRCRGCGKTKALSGFPRHPMMGDGHLNFCAECVSEKGKAHYLKHREEMIRRARNSYWKNREAILAREREHYHAHKAEIRRAERKRLKEDPDYREHRRAFARLNYKRHRESRILSGKIYRRTKRGRSVLALAHEKEKRIHALHIAARRAVQSALRSGYLTKPVHCRSCGGDGRIEAHHHKGYAPEKWLTVQWLCVKCHKEADNRIVEKERESHAHRPAHRRPRGVCAAQ